MAVDLDGSYSYSKVIYLQRDRGVNSLQIYPNPNQGVFVVNLPESNVAQTAATLSLWDIHGQMLWEQTVPTNARTIQTHAPQLQSCVYFITYTTDAGSRKTQRIVVQ